MGRCTHRHLTIPMSSFPIDRQGPGRDGRTRHVLGQEEPASTQYSRCRGQRLLPPLRPAPWVMGGDWNATPDRVWAHVLSPRVGGFLPGPAVREPTCFPSQGDPSELDFFLLSRSLRNAVAGYDYLPVGQLPTHRAVRLTLRLQGLIDMVPTLRRPRALAPLLQQQQDQPDGPPAAAPPWGRPLQLGPSAQASWDRWTRRAEQWLLSAAGVPDDRAGPYRGRGEGPVVKQRRLLPRFTEARTGEVHGRAHAWAVRAARFRDLARCQAHGRTVQAGHIRRP